MTRDQSARRPHDAMTIAIAIVFYATGGLLLAHLLVDWFLTP